MRPAGGDVLGGRYRLTDRIAIGGMGEVWRATDDVLSRDVAVKVLKEEFTGDAGFLQRFRAEARHAAALTHPNIAGVYDYGEADASAYLVMELVPGEPLSDVLAREGALPPQEAMGLLAQAAQGLAAAHAAGVVHRDVKPGNLLVTPDGRVKVTDFGIARAADSAPLTATGQVMGTAQYLAPEQAMGQPSSPASDVYALGVVAYEALAGRRPFTGDSQVAVAMAHVNTDPPPLPAGLPEGARALVGAAMAKDPAARPADAAVFARAAQAVARGDDAGALAALGAAGAAGAAAGAAATEVLRSRPDVATTRAMPVTAGAASAPPPPPPSTPTSPPAPGRPRRRLTGPLVALLALVAFVVAGALLADRLTGWPGAADPQQTATAPAVPTGDATIAPPDEEPTTTAPTTTEPASPTESLETDGPQEIEIVADDYVGLDRSDARRQLEDLGLDVEVEREQDTDAEADTVISVSEGTFEEGDTVTLVVADPSGGPTDGDN